jgi:hypothetical protein
VELIMPLGLYVAVALVAGATFGVAYHLRKRHIHLLQYQGVGRHFPIGVYVTGLPAQMMTGTTTCGLRGREFVFVQGPTLSGRNAISSIDRFAIRAIDVQKRDGDTPVYEVVIGCVQGSRVVQRIVFRHAGDDALQRANFAAASLRALCE